MGQVKLIQNKKITCLYSSLCSDFQYMKGHSGLETPLPEIIHSVKQSDFKVMDYDSFKSGSTPSFIQQLNMSVHPDHAWWDREISTEAAQARCSAYLELEGGVADTSVLSYLADILPPVVQNKYGPLGWIPTLALTCNIRQLPQTNLLFIDGLAKDISNGYFEQDCYIWDMNGNLVATSRQLAKILKSEEKNFFIIKKRKQMKFTGTKNYVSTEDLSMAVNATIALERPLIIKGEPGTGKTLLAIEVAESLGMELIEWHVKSTTKASQGLYEYDAVTRLRILN